MTRKEFLKLAAGPVALAAMPEGRTPADQTDDGSKAIRVINDTFELVLTPGMGLKTRLVHKPTGIVLADGDYSYAPGTPTFTSFQSHDRTAELKGDFGNGLTLIHTFRLNDDLIEPAWMEERVMLLNASTHPIAVAFRCGFVLPVGPNTLSNYVFTAVPYRREPTGGRGQYADYTLDQVLHSRRRSRLRYIPDLNTDVVRKSQQQMFTDDYISEAWALTDGKQGFLISKYNQAGRDFALLDSVPAAHDMTGLRWGGAGQPLANVEGCYRLAPGEIHDFGVTRLTSFSGDLTQGFYAYRAETESRGHVLPPNYDPPSHWNELYDNKLWWTGKSSNPDLRKKFYSLDDMKFAAARAQDMGLEALYCDPGWDTPQSSKIWGAERLGPLPDFLALLKNQYGDLKLALHTPLSGWPCYHADLPPGTPMINENGGASNRPCGASNQYVEVTVKRLGDLAAAGVAFFMFDGTVYVGECFSKDHGHALPSTTDEYVDRANKIACDVHKDHPDVLIEMHDQLLGGVPMRYVPSYYGHGKYAPGKHGWDEIWAFELMWSPLGDIVGGHSMALYYFNLAYSIPLYIHVDLRQDTPQGLMLWWNISTCRHLGVGGTHPDPNIRAFQKQTIATYRRLKRYFCNGTFHGIDEITHVHVHPDGKSAVINCFNLGNDVAHRDVSFDRVKYGLRAAPTTFKGADSFTIAGNIHTLKVGIPPMGHTLIEVS